MRRGFRYFAAPFVYLDFPLGERFDEVLLVKLRGLLHGGRTQFHGLSPPVEVLVIDKVTKPTEN